MSEAWGLITRAQVVSRAASQWKEMYEKTTLWTNPFTCKNKLNLRTAKEVYEELKEAKTSNEVNTIIGNEGWAKVDCDICDKRDCFAVVSLDNDNGGSIYVCESCIDKMKEKLYDYKTYYWPVTNE